MYSRLDFCRILLMSGAAISFIIVAVVAYFLYTSRKRKAGDYKMPANLQQLLSEHVAFYNNLGSDRKSRFEARVKDFLERTVIRGVGVEVEDLDRVLVASGAIMLIFSFPDWKYNNISEVLLYKDTFNKAYSTEGSERNVLGMVGDGALHREMILSQKSLRESFSNPDDGHNTAIHEFAHLIDKADGSTDGVPEYLLTREQLQPWVALVRKTIEEIRTKGHSDINYYGATNEAEFFAVITEYFFERPDKLEEHHPELYRLLNEMFHPSTT